MFLFGFLAIYSCKRLILCPPPKNKNAAFLAVTSSIALIKLSIPCNLPILPKKVNTTLFCQPNDWINSLSFFGIGVTSFSIAQLDIMSIELL